MSARAIDLYIYYLYLLDIDIFISARLEGIYEMLVLITVINA